MKGGRAGEGGIYDKSGEYVGVLEGNGGMRGMLRVKVVSAVGADVQSITKRAIVAIKLFSSTER